jgi:hypothetical protein
MHLAYIVRIGDNTSEIAAKYGLPEPTLLRINNITSSSCQMLRQGHILDIPLFQGIVYTCLFNLLPHSKKYVFPCVSITKIFLELYIHQLRHLFSDEGGIYYLVAADHLIN